MDFIRRITTALAAAWREGQGAGPDCRRCLRPPAASESVFCDACADEEIRQRIGTLDASEAVGWARNVALRDNDHELAAALQAVLLLHLTGWSLAPVTALVLPDQSSQVVN